MADRLRDIPTYVLRAEARRLELDLIAGTAASADIDAFAAVSCELGRRLAATPGDAVALDAVLDPRD